MDYEELVGLSNEELAKEFNISEEEVVKEREEFCEIAAEMTKYILLAISNYPRNEELKSLTHWNAVLLKANALMCIAIVSAQVDDIEAQIKTLEACEEHCLAHFQLSFKDAKSQLWALKDKR